MPYDHPSRFPCPFCESLHERIPWVPVLSSNHSQCEVSDCERTPGGGALLVWPKRHVEKLSDLEEHEIVDLGDLINASAQALLHATRADGLHTFCSTGTLAGQSEAHIHFQLQPRYHDTDYSFASARDLPVIRIEHRKRFKERLLGMGMGVTQPPRLEVNKDLSFSSVTRKCLAVTSFTEVSVPYKRRSQEAIVLSPRRPVSSIYDLVPEERADLMWLLREFVRMIERKFDPDGLNVWWDSGIAAGQTYREAIVEVVPRFKERCYRYIDREQLEEATEDEVDDCIRKYQDVINDISGILK